MNIGVTGVSGILGGTLFECLKQKNENLIRIDRDLFKPDTSISTLISFLKINHIDLVVHCAANTNVEKCEIEIEQCYADNLLRTEILAIACQKIGIKFVFISSTGVYGSKKRTPYYEFDNVEPTTHHHNSKYQAELSVTKLIPDALIIRTGWLFGGTADATKNFVVNRYKEALISKTFIKSDISQFGCPTYANDLANQIFVLIELGLSGVFNCVSEGGVSRYEYVSEIIKLFELEIEVKPVDGNDFNRVAKVSNNEMALNYKLDNFNCNVMRPWKTALEDYINLIKGDLI